MFATLSLSLACELFFGFMGRYGSRVFSCIYEPSKLESLRFIRMDAETCYEVAAARF